MEEADATSSFTTLRNLCAGLPAFFSPQAQAATTASLQLESKASQIAESARSPAIGVASDSRTDITTYAPPPEVQQFLWDVLEWRDGMMRGLALGIESIPGLSDLLEQLTDVLNQCEPSVLYCIAYVHVVHVQFHK